MTASTRWIVIVVGLLAGNALAVAILLAAAGGDTGRRVLPDYYRRAAAWDLTRAEAASSARLGWSCAVRTSGRELELTCRDRSGAPLAGAAVEVQATPRGRADEPIAVRLAPGSGGVHRGSIAGRRHGIHELAISVERADQRWSAVRVVELTGGDR